MDLSMILDFSGIAIYVLTAAIFVQLAARVIARFWPSYWMALKAVLAVFIIITAIMCLLVQFPLSFDNLIYRNAIDIIFIIVCFSLGGYVYGSLIKRPDRKAIGFVKGILIQIIQGVLSIALMIYVFNLLLYLEPNDYYLKMRAQNDVRSTFPTALDMYKADNGDYPMTEQGLQALIKEPLTRFISKNWCGPYIKEDGLIDPWKHRYVYYYFPERGQIEILSIGPDGLRGTKDDIKNVINLNNETNEADEELGN